MQKVEPIVRWPGGKRRLADRIIEKIPPHDCYVEVFGGGLAVLCAKERSQVEVVNDLDSDLINVYRVVRFHLDELLKEVECLLNSREEFTAEIAQPGLTDIQRAARWWHRNVISFAGLGEHFGRSRTGGGAAMGGRARRLEGLEALNKRLDKVCIENLDWRRCLELYDGDNVAMYLDPPYVEGHQYDSPWGQADHEQLRERLRTLRGAWVLSYDDAPLVRELYADCDLTEVTRARGIGNNHPTMRRELRELIITPR